MPEVLILNMPSPRVAPENQLCKILIVELIPCPDGMYFEYKECLHSLYRYLIY